MGAAAKKAAAKKKPAAKGKTKKPAAAKPRSKKPRLVDASADFRQALAERAARDPGAPGVVVTPAEVAQLAPPAPQLNELERKALDLYELAQHRKETERREDELKSFFKDLAGDARALAFKSEVAGVGVNVTEESRDSWDDAKLREFIGEERVAEFRKQSTFLKVTVRKLEAEGAA